MQIMAWPDFFWTMANTSGHQGEMTIFIIKYAVRRKKLLNADTIRHRQSPGRKGSLLQDWPLMTEEQVICCNQGKITPLCH